MGRVNKFTQGVFTNIIGSPMEIPEFDRFQSIQDELIKPFDELKGSLSTYNKLITDNKVMFENLARLENVIMQMRVRDNMSYDDVKLNILREYIYARVPFHRLDKDVKDIRVIVGQTKDFGYTTDELYGNKKFMDLAINKLTLAMDLEINNNNKELKKLKLI